ncbi:hypothetical protein PM082_022087 [Marasmius tenuissimus]|nr:hypothetical protein PM082_022087 [Marasmius tenuissimus]
MQERTEVFRGQRVWTRNRSQSQMKSPYVARGDTRGSDSYYIVAFGGGTTGPSQTVKSVNLIQSLAGGNFPSMRQNLAGKETYSMGQVFHTLGTQKRAKVMFYRPDSVNNSKHKVQDPEIPSPAPK